MCMYSDFNGKCELFDKSFLIDNLCCDEYGNCLCEDDPIPSMNCEEYDE